MVKIETSSKMSSLAASVLARGGIAGRRDIMRLAGCVLAQTTGAGKVTSKRMARLAARVLAGKKARLEDVLQLAGCVLSQDETKGKNKAHK